MEGNYPILMGGKEIGTVNVSRQGLYYHFACRCDLGTEVIYRLTVTCGSKTHRLGIPVPEAGAFTLRTRLPAKLLEEGKLQFRAQPKHSPMEENFIPISPEEPFAYLSRLKDAFLEVRQGVPGVVIPENGEG